MAVVAGGLGLPEEGALVTQGLGLAGVADPNAMSAHLTGSGSVTADLTGSGVAPPASVPGVGGFVPRLRRLPKREPIPAFISAHLGGTSALTAVGEVLDHRPPPIDFTAIRRRRERELVLVGAL